jgi:hypothetical protein
MLLLFCAKNTTINNKMTKINNINQVSSCLEGLLQELQSLSPSHLEGSHIFGKTLGERKYLGIKYKPYPIGEGKFFAVYSDRNNEGVEFPEAIIDYRHHLYPSFKKVFKRLQRKALKKIKSERINKPDSFQDPCFEADCVTEGVYDADEYHGH